MSKNFLFESICNILNTADTPPPKVVDAANRILALLPKLERREGAISMTDPYDHISLDWEFRRDSSFTLWQASAAANFWFG